jgi:hypothetical protein
MKKTILVMVPVLVLILLSGCLDSNTTVTVGSDGSGKVEQTFIMKHEILLMLQSLGALGGEGSEPEEISLLDEDKLAASASSMGEGVTYAGAQETETVWGKGYIAVYTFEDINTLRINQNPSASMPEMDGGDSDIVEELITFEFSPGNTAELKVFLPQEDMSTDSSEAEAAAESGSSDDMDPEMLKTFYEGMAISLYLDIDGEIISTDATAREGSRISLLEIKFDKILEDPEVFDSILTNQMETIEQMKAVIGAVPGLSMELKDTVSVTFR